MSDDAARLDATGQADLVRRRAISPTELLDATIARIERYNPTLNAIIHTDYERARAAAADVVPGSAPFAGVPFILKDIGANQAGWPYWMGNRRLEAIDHRSAVDSELGARFRRAGLITVGKSNLPEFGTTPTTQPLGRGPTNNPWDLSRSPAGSSGGSAAAVAAGIVAMAHANDGGGSTRLPAAWCGLVGLKATRGRVSDPTLVWRLVSELAVTRTVRDTAALLDAVHGATDADLYRAADPLGPYTDELGRVVAPLRVGVVTTGSRPVDPACVVAVEKAAAVLEGAGHHVDVFDGETLFGAPSQVNGQLWMAAIAGSVEGAGALAGSPLTEADVEPFNWAAAERGRAMAATTWMAGEEAQQAWVCDAVASMADIDLLVTPTAGCPPLTTAELEPPTDKPWKIGRVHAEIGQFTLPFNATGHPAISLPLHQTDGGLPVGVQFVAGMGREDLLLRLGRFFEEALPWADRHPDVGVWT